MRREGEREGTAALTAEYKEADREEGGGGEREREREGREEEYL